MFLGDGLERYPGLKASLHGSSSLFGLSEKGSVRVHSIVFADGGERCCPEPDSPASSRDFIDDSEGEVVGDGLRDYGGGSDSDTSIELLVLRVSRHSF